MAQQQHETHAPPLGVTDSDPSQRLHHRLQRSHWRVALVGLAALALALVTLLFFITESRRMVHVESPAALAAVQIMEGVHRSAAALRAYALFRDENYRAEREAAWTEDIDPAMERIAPVWPGGFQERLQFQDALAALRRAQESVEAKTAELPEAQGADPVADLMLNETLPKLRTVLTSLSGVVRTTGETMRATLERENQRSAMASGAVIVLMVLTAITAWIMARRSALAITRPVAVLTEGARLLATGRLREDLPVERIHELGQLARAFNQLRVALALAEQKYRSLFAHTSNSMLLLEPDSFRIFDVNAAFEALTGYKRRELEGVCALDLFEGEARENLQKSLRALALKSKGAAQALSLNPPKRPELILDVSMSLIEAASARVIELTFVDMTAQHEKQRALQDIAYKDGLTGLFNQRLFHKRLEDEVALAHQDNRPLCLIFVDLDNFKKCNDTYGHQAGDELLRGVGEIVTQCIREGRDSGFRYGGDEFGVILPGAPPHVGQRIAQRISEEFLGRQQYGTSMSIGIAELREGLDSEQLLKKADEALYAAKSAGKNTIRLAE